MEYHDYYGTLGIDRGASQPEIQRAYRKLARQYHPDINRDPGAEARFKQIGEAYEVLKDEDRRARYDQFGAAWKAQQRTGAPPPGWENVRFDFGQGGGGFDFGAGGTGFSSFFEMLFGGGGAGTGYSQHHEVPPRRGADHRSILRISLHELSEGSKRKITLTHPDTGKPQTLEITVPKGVRPGQKIRLAGRGGTGLNGGGPGDLLLSVELERHPDFRVEGDDLYTAVAVSASKAALGGEARVKTLEGVATVKLPAGSSSGRKIRLRERGLPTGNGSRGDLFGEVRIVVPPELSAAQRELFEKLADLESEEAGG